MLKISIFKIQINCPGCSMFHTVTSLSSRQTCQNCGKKINMSLFLRNNLLGAAVPEQYMNAFLSGNVEQSGGTGGVEHPGSYRLSYSSAQTYCEECAEPINESLLLDAINGKKPVKCTKCSHAMPVKLADKFVREFHPKAIAVINDSEGIDEAEKNTEKSSTLVFTCMSCGGGLELNRDTGRTTKCTYCGNENYLPDAIWTKLHPHKKVSPLFVILDLDGNDFRKSISYFLRVTEMKIYDRHFENFIREYFEKPFTSDAVNSWFKEFLSVSNNKESSFNIDIEKIQRSFYNHLSLGYASHNLRLREVAAAYGKNIPEELQQKMAVDADESVRLVLAGNNSLHKDVIKKLQNDASPLVAAEAKKRKTGFLNKLFG